MSVPDHFLTSDPTTSDSTPISVGSRVARWHQTYATQCDPIPGTVVAVGKRYVTVDFDRLTADDEIRRRRVEPRNLTAWSEPPEHP